MGLYHSVVPGDAGAADNFRASRRSAGVEIVWMRLIPLMYNPGSFACRTGESIIIARTGTKTLLVILMLVTMTGCTTIVGGLTSRMADDLASAILNSDDVDTVREGVPAYLLLIDSFLRNSPDDRNLLLAASTLNGAFTVFVEGERAKLLAGHALDYAFRAACLEEKAWCGIRDRDFDTYRNTIDGLGPKSVPVAYAVGVAWAGWIQMNTDDWNAIAELARVKYLMEHVLRLDETFENGGAHLYMGGLETIFPASMGGHPEKGREHFERAIALSGGRYLMAKVVYARQYARLVFDRTLHDRLLHEVLSADPVVDGMTLTNKIAQREARELLDTSDEYF